MRLIVHSDLGLKVKVMKREFFFRNWHAGNELNGDLFLDTPKISYYSF